MKNKQLTAANRGAIEVLLHKDFSLIEIAKEVGVDKSTISREIKNRSTPTGYFANIAQIDYESKRSNCRRKRKLSNSRYRNYVIEKIKIGWSPEQIAGRLNKLEDGLKMKIHHETIYKFIYEDKICIEEKMYQYLRYGRKKRKKQTGRSVKKSKIPNRVSISKRSKIVDKRTEIGHWEGDSVIYPNLKAINTVNELKTGYVIFTKLNRKTAKLTANAMTQALKKNYSKTLTLDNGTEFTYHEYVKHNAKVKTYFCHPYSSWERGANENCNMLLRGYLPKKYNIDKLKQCELDEIAEELNNRPRKRLGYKTPAEAYQWELNNLIKNVAVGNRM